MVRWAADGTSIPTNLFEAALWHYALKPVCHCGHSATFNPHGLWWHFQRRGLDIRLSAVRLRFWCRVCRSKGGKRVRPVRIEIVRESAADVKLPFPPEDRWKREVRRVRS